MCPPNSQTKRKNTYLGLGCSQNGRVCIQDFSVSIDKNGDNAVWWVDDGINPANYKDGVYDGFGSTIQMPGWVRHA